MLNRTLLFLVIAVAVSALLCFGTCSSAAADEERALFYADSAIFLGQSPHDARRNPTTIDQIRRVFNRIWQDDSSDHSNHNPQPPATVYPGERVQPPRPLTSSETQQAIDTFNQPLQRATTGTGNTTQLRAGSVAAIRDATDENSGSGERPIHVRLRDMRESVFNNPDVERVAHQSRQAQRTPLTSLPIFQDAGNNSGGLTGNSRDFAELPMMSRVPAGLEGQDAFQLNAANQQGLSRSDRTVLERGMLNQMADPLAALQQSTQRLTMSEADPRRETSRQRLVSTSPRLEFEIEKPDSAVVGQEITYRIRAMNVGDVPAEQVKLHLEIPPWIDVRHTDADNGNWVLLPRSDGSGIADLEWRVNRINQRETNQLALWLVPQLHRAIELPMRYDFDRPAIVAKVEVQEPKLVMELVGPDEVRWNDFVSYTLIVRNIGNGSAEGLKFELQQTSSERQTSAMDYPLLPGEGQEIPIEVQAGRDQEHIDIAVLATGAHDLRSEVRRRIRVMRPKLEMSVQTSPLHFVDEPAEILIRIVNNGNADAEDTTIRAELPLGAQYVTSSEGGLSILPQQQNLVEWRGRSIGKGQMQTLSLICFPRREGECRVSVEAREANGSSLAAGHGTFTAEAIVELNLAVQRPNGPIELGQEVKYTIEVANTGTKAAENVEISMMFGDQLEPLAVTGRDASYGDGQVFFDKIPAILPKQVVTLMVHVEAKRAGTAQIRAEVVRTDASGSSVRSEQVLSSHVYSRQRGMATVEPPAQK